jgi:hypothetical protein
MGIRAPRRERGGEAGARHHNVQRGRTTIRRRRPRPWAAQDVVVARREGGRVQLSTRILERLCHGPGARLRINFEPETLLKGRNWS